MVPSSNVGLIAKSQLKYMIECLLYPSPGVFPFACDVYWTGPVGSPDGIPTVYHYLSMQICEKAAVSSTFS